MPAFGRLPEFDPRSRRFAAVDHSAAAGRAPRSYTWRVGLWLDQGQTSACTGFAVAHEAAARPKIVRGLTNADGLALYRRAQQLDPWPGEEPAYEGSSVLAAVKAGQERGWFGEYRWAFGEDDLAQCLGWLGPAILGVSWLRGMLDPDERGYIHATGPEVGGHAILCCGLSLRHDRYLLHNSWSRGWGRDGTAYISRADLRRLLLLGGEACIPVQRLIPRL